MPPGTAAGEHVDDSGEHRPIIERRPAAALRPRPEAGQQRFDDLPQRIRYQPGRQRIDHDGALCRTNDLDHKRHALIFAGLKWAIFRTEAPLLTSDEPVVLIGAPGTDRSEKPGLLTTAVVVFPLSPDRLLALFNPLLMSPPRYPFVLNDSEVTQINAELMATAEKEVYERPSDWIAADISVPPRGEGKPLVDSDGTVVTRYRKPTRWASITEPPAPPVPRWFEPEDWLNPSSGTGCQVLGCGRGVDMPLQLPELVEHVRDNPFSYYERYAYVCADHHRLLRTELSRSVRGYMVDFRWRNPDTDRRELRIGYPAADPC